jgi:hypothetical protein
MIEDIELLKRSLDYAGTHPELIFLISNIKDITTSLKDILRGQLSDIKEISVFDSREAAAILFDRAKLKPDCRDGYLIDFRDGTNVTMQKKREMARTLNEGRQGIFNRIGGRGYNLSLFITVDEGGVAELRSMAPDFVSVMSCLTEINKADLPPVIDTATKEIFGPNTPLPAVTKLGIGD